MKPVASNVAPTNDHNYPAYDYPVGIGTGLIAPKAGVVRDLPGVATRALMSPLKNGQAWPNAGGGSPNSGNVLVIDHGNNEFTAWLHVTPFDVNAYRGRIVSQGEHFALSGHNGWSTGPHLHFEVWKNGQRIDPGPWLANINQGGTMPTIVDDNITRLLYSAIMHRIPDPVKDKNQYDAWRGREIVGVITDMYKSGEWNDIQNQLTINKIRADKWNELGQVVGLSPDKDGLDAIIAKVKTLGDDYVPVTEQLYKKKG